MKKTDEIEKMNENLEKNLEKKLEVESENHKIVKPDELEKMVEALDLRNKNKRQLIIMNNVLRIHNEIMVNSIIRYIMIKVVTLTEYSEMTLVLITDSSIMKRKKIGSNYKYNLKTHKMEENTLIVEASKKLDAVKAEVHKTII